MSKAEPGKTRKKWDLGWTGEHGHQTIEADITYLQQIGAEGNEGPAWQEFLFLRAGNLGFIFYVLWNLPNFEMLATNFLKSWDSIKAK